MSKATKTANVKEKLFNFMGVEPTPRKRLDFKSSASTIPPEVDILNRTWDPTKNSPNFLENSPNDLIKNLSKNVIGFALTKA